MFAEDNWNNEAIFDYNDNYSDYCYSLFMYVKALHNLFLFFILFAFPSISFNQTGHTFHVIYIFYFNLKFPDGGEGIQLHGVKKKSF